MKKPLLCRLHAAAAIVASTFCISGALNAQSLDWADITSEVGAWKTSSWYDTFYYESTYVNWIWHCEHGWQYVYPVSTAAGTYVWEDASQSWLYTSSTYYPYVYSFSNDKWFYFQGGVTPEREFWDFAVDASVGEGEMATFGSSLNPYMNAEVSETTLNTAGTFNVFDNYAPTVWPNSQSPLEVGTSANIAVLRVSNKSVISCSALSIGSDTTRGYLDITHGALVKCSSLSISDGNTIDMGAGFLALSGDQRTAVQTLVDDLKFVFIYDYDNGGIYPQIIINDMNVAFYADSVDGESAAFAATGHEGLRNSTVITSGMELPDVSWANATSSDKWWYVSPWYGTFYQDVSFDGSIWHQQYGYQYIHEGSTADNVNIWDYATNSEWNTSSSSYPTIYNYEDGKFYIYLRGTTPNRVFQEVASGNEVNESSLIKQ